jgi:hypothetical protein
MVMAQTAGFALRDDIGGIARHALHDGTGRNRAERARAEHDHGLLTVGPRAEAQHRLERFAADDQRIDGRHELVVAVRFGVRR